MTNIRTTNDALRYLTSFGMVAGIIFGIIYTQYSIIGPVILVLGIVCSILYVLEVKGVILKGK